jgi:membrane protein
MKKGGMRSRFKKLTFVQIIIDSVKDFADSDSMIFAAGTAFYTLFSMPALLIILLNIGTTFYQEEQIRQEILAQVASVVGSEGAATLDGIMSNLSMEFEGVLANIIAISILSFSATTVFIGLQNSLNHIWHLKAKPERGWLKFIINRLMSFLLVVILGFLLLASLILDALVVIIFNYFSYLLEDFSRVLIQISHFILAQGLIVVIFALMYKILPDAKVKWKDTWLGAFVTMLLFAIGKFLIGLFMSTIDLGTSYGTAGSLVVLLVWIYYSIVIFLFGAQITYYIAEKMGGNIIPIAQAIKVELREIEEPNQEV